jgi:hypothetical protein
VAMNTITMIAINPYFGNQPIFYLANVIAMATLLARANVERGVEVVITWKHREQRG